MPPVAEVAPSDYSDVLRMVQDRPERGLIQSVLLRSQSMAAYQPDNRGHFGLSLQAYAHFTSPIRRYPDLLVHRAIRYAWTGGKPDGYSYSPGEMASMAVHCSQRERRAEEAERDVDERFKCAWMSKHVGSEFDGTVAGVTSFGLFVELDESRVSGLVHISQLANDYYHFDAVRKLLKGERTGTQFRLGDHVRVQVLRASLEDRKIDFRMVPSRARATPPIAASKYDYAASGERYSLPKKVAATRQQGMFGRAAQAIGRAFGRKEPSAAIEPVIAASRQTALRDNNPPPRARAAGARSGNNGQRPGKAPASGKPGAPQARGPRKDAVGSGRHAPTSAGAASTPKKSPRRKPKPKGKP
jgi:ribonuclease R